MKLNYKRFGTGEPLLILHGFLGMLDNWQRPGNLLAPDFDVYIIDLRNHGHSGHSDEHNYDVMTADVIELMDDQNIQKAHILGHSMGGKVAMKIAQDHPDRVMKLVVADIGPRYYPVRHQWIFKALNAVPVESIDKRSDAESHMEPYIQESGIRQFLLKNLHRKAQGGFRWRFNLAVLEKNIDEVGRAMKEKEFEGATLFVRGGRSDYITDADWPDIKVLFPKACLHTIDGAGHWLHAEQPEDFVDAVREFLLD